MDCKKWRGNRIRPRVVYERDLYARLSRLVLVDLLECFVNGCATI